LIFRFGPFELDDGSGDLLQDGKPVRLQPKPLALLRILVVEHHRVVPTEELQAALWPDTTVTPSSLPRAASYARRAIGDTQKGRMIRSYPRRGYRFCADVVALEHAPRDGAQDEGREQTGLEAEIPFVGRAEAFEGLMRGFGEAARGRGGCAIVSGSAGIGKSRLVEEFGREAARRGGRVCVGAARDHEGMPALWIWEQILRQLARDPHLASEARSFAERTSELSELLPELGAPELDESEANATEARRIEQSRFRFLHASTRFLSRCARERPLVLLLEDLQWAGPASLRLLEHLSAELEAEPILFVVTLREESRARDARVTRSLAQLQRLKRCISIPLRGLSRGQVSELLERVAGQRAPADLTSELYAQTEGVPLFLREAIRVLRRRSDLSDPRRIAELGFALPEPARELIGRALRELSESSSRLVRAAAVIGREFDLRTTASVAQLTPLEALECIDEASSAGVLEAVHDAAAQYRFAHALYREIVYSELSTVDRAQLHLRAVEQLERRHAADLDRVVAELAHHHLQAIAVGDPERTYDFAMRAALRAERSCAYEQVANHYEQALEALSHCDPIDPVRRLGVLLRLGSAHRLAGDRAQRRAVLARALDDARVLRRNRDFARAAIDFCDIAEWSHDDPAARMALDEALDALGEEHPVERARLLTRLAYLAQRNRDEAEPYARQGVELARGGGDPDSLQDALYVLGYTIAGPHDLEERDRIADEMLALARRNGAHTPCVITLIDAASDRIALGDLSGALERRDQTKHLVGPHPTPVMVWHMRVFDTGLALLRGDLEHAEELTESAFQVGQRIDHPFALGCYIAHRVGVARERGDFERAIEWMSQIRGPDAPHVWVRSMLARTHLANGDRAAAEAIWNDLTASAGEFPAVAPGIRWTNSMVELAHLCADLRDHKHAEPLIRALAPVEHHHGVLPVPICYGGPVAHCTGRLHALLGERDPAERAFTLAIEQVRTLGARPAEARLLLDYAGHVRARDARRSAELERIAHAIAAELGARLGPASPPTEESTRTATRGGPA